MSVVMNNNQKILPFPKAPEESGASTIVVQIGDERFAIHWEVEDLPPVQPPVLWKRGTKKGAAILNSLQILPVHRTCFSAPKEGGMGGPKRAGNHMQMETQYLRLRTPVALGSRFDDWQVCWLGG
jgi:hypothetical protein